jgi:hypothetical protein
MFLTKRFHRELLTEQRERYEAQLAEKERIIAALAEQIDWLRNIMGRPALVAQAAANPSDQPERFESSRPYVTELEEEIEYQRKAGRITEEQADEFLAEFGVDFGHDDI